MDGGRHYCSPKRPRGSRRRSSEETDSSREYRHYKWDWKACYRDHDSFMNTLRWLHSQMRTPIQEESESDESETNTSVADTVSQTSAATEPPPCTSLPPDLPPRRTKLTSTGRKRSPRPPNYNGVNRVTDSSVCSRLSPKRISSEPLALRASSGASVKSKRRFEPEGDGEVVNELRARKERKVPPVDKSVVFENGLHLPLNGYQTSTTTSWTKRHQHTPLGNESSEVSPRSDHRSKQRLCNDTVSPRDGAKWTEKANRSRTDIRRSSSRSSVEAAYYDDVAPRDLTPRNRRKIAFSKPTLNLPAWRR